MKKFTKEEKIEIIKYKNCQWTLNGTIMEAKEIPGQDAYYFAATSDWTDFYLYDLVGFITRQALLEEGWIKIS